MKILHIAPTPFFSDRGCHMRILGEILELQTMGFNVVLVTYHNGRDIDNLLIKRITNIPWYNKIEAGPSWHKLYLDLLLLVNAVRIGWINRPDIIHGHLHEGALIGKAMSLLLSGGKIPVIFDVQGSLTGELETHGFFNEIKVFRVVFRLMERFICKLPDYLVCSSESSTLFIKNKMSVPARKVMALPDGIFSNYFIPRNSRGFREQLGIPDGKKIVVYTGALTSSKGIEYFLEAIPLVLAAFRDVHFLVVGYPIEDARAQVRRLKVEHAVSFTGKVDYFELPKYLSCADVAVDPKLEAGAEGSGKIINYMGAGLPVVCFDTLNNRALLGSSEYAAKFGDTEDLSRKIVSFLEDDNLARRVGNTNKEIVENNFSWAKSGKKLADLYLRLNKPGTRGRREKG